jgi:ubiquinone/menaquinone biosynthesis C-methylase UbiE
VIALARVDARELMDDPVDSLAELEGNLCDIERANRFFGGLAPIVRETERIGARTILDVGCGSADIPGVLARRARRQGRLLSVTCLDRSAQMLDIAQRRTGEASGLRFVRGDGFALPFEGGSFDAAICSLTLHHCTPPEAVALLRELRRVAARTPIVCDLRRSRLALIATWLFTRLVTRNRLTRHDGPLSIRRAYTPREALELAREAGWRAPAVRRERWFRMTLVDGGAAEFPR